MAVTVLRGTLSSAAGDPQDSLSEASSTGRLDCTFHKRPKTSVSTVTDWH